MKKYFMTVLSAAAISCAALAEDTNSNLNVENTLKGTVNTNSNVTVQPSAGKIRALNTDPTGVYSPTNVEAKLNIAIKDDTKTVHFIRDNNNPFVVSKAYVIKNADPYILRGVLLSIVLGSIPENPVAIETIKYVDGSAVLLVSAEEYRFKDVGNGMSMDKVIEMLDRKGLPNSTGTTDMTYFPKYSSAKTLLSMMEKSGIGLTGATPLSSACTHDENGLHVPQLGFAMTDDNMNAILMTSPGYDINDALNFLKEVDAPPFEIMLNYKLVEVYAENDQKLGLDFQAWKNNDGIDLFTAGGRYSTNWTAQGLTPNQGYTYSHFYNVNPKWNSKYIDFLTTCGKAKIVSNGSLVVANEGLANLTLTDGMFSIVVKDIRDENGDKFTLEDLLPSTAAGGSYAERIAGIATDLLTSHEVREGKTQNTEAESQGNLFTLVVGGDVHSRAANLSVSMNSTSLIGWDGQGRARLTTSSYATNIQIDSARKDFVIGGITKTSVVRSVSGLPLLKDLPILGWIFSTETDTVKKSQFILMASAQLVKHGANMDGKDAQQLDAIRKSVNKAEQNPAGTLGFQQLLIDQDK